MSERAEKEGTTREVFDGLGSSTVPKISDRLTLALLRLGVAVPFGYFGLQLVTAPFYQRYSFVTNVASELGSDRAPYRSVFNFGIIGLGVVILLAALGYFRALSRLGTHPALKLLTTAALLTNGVQSVWAGVYPLPDPRHGGHPTFVIAMLSIPFLLSADLWRHLGRPAKVYLIFAMLTIVAMIPVFTGLTGIDARAISGLLQRVLASAVFIPIGVGAYVLLRRVERYDLQQGGLAAES